MSLTAPALLALAPALMASPGQGATLGWVAAHSALVNHSARALRAAIPPPPTAPAPGAVRATASSIALGDAAGGPPASPTVTDLRRALPTTPGSARDLIPPGRPDDAPCPGPWPGGVVRLDEVVERALCTDPRTRLSWAQWRAQAAQEQLERAAAGPTLNATFGAGQAWARTDEAGTRLGGRGRVFHAGLDAAWVLYDFGQRDAAVEAARLAVVAAAASHDRSVQEVYLAAARAHYALVEAQGVLALIRESERYTGDVLRLAIRPDDKRAAIDRLGQLQARTALSRIALERRQAEGVVAQARGELAVRMGLAVHTLLEVDMPGTPTAGSPSITQWSTAVETLIDQALRVHPELVSARARLGAARSQLDAARHSDRPTLSAVHSQRRARDAFGAFDTQRAIGLELSIPLSAWRDRQPREQLARSQLEAAQAEVDTAEQQTALDIWAAYQEVHTQLLALTEAQRYQASARELLAAEQAAFQAGEGDMFDVLDASESVLEAARAELVAVSTLRYQRLRLAAGLGRLPQAGGSALPQRLPPRRP